MKVLVVLLGMMIVATSLQAAGRKVLPGHVPKAVARLQPAASLPETQPLELALTLPLHNEAALDALLRRLYDPASPAYRQYLTPEQFTQRFGPTETDYQKVIAFAHAQGMTVSGTHPNRLVLDVRGPVANIQEAFRVRMRVYQHPTEDRTFYAPDAEPSVDADVPLQAISGLDNYVLPHPMNLRTPQEVRSYAIGCAGQTITLPSGRYTTLLLLGTAVMGNQNRQAFTVAYTDNSTTTFSQDLSDWYSPQHYAAESTAVAMPYRDQTEMWSSWPSA